MPGLSVYIGSINKRHNISKKIDKISQDVFHRESYSHIKLVDSDNTKIGFTAYDSYPRNIYKNNRFIIVLEGMIYNKEINDIKKTLFEFANELSAGKNITKKLRDFLLSSDGEFLILFYDNKKKELTLINDFMGRLPLYYHLDKDFLLISRELSFVQSFLSTTEFSKEGLMEFLLYGTPLDENTLFDNIFRLRPATVMQYDSKSRDFSKKILYHLNFEEKKKFPKKGKEPDVLRDLFLKGLENRINALKDRKLVATISGGLDTRGLLAGLIKLGADIQPISYIYPDFSEEKYVDDLAEEYGIKITKQKSKKPGIKEYKRISILREGVVSAYSAFNLSNFEKVIKKYSENIAVFMGTHGGELLRYQNLALGMKSEDEFVDYLIDSPDRYIYMIKNGMKMLGLKEDYKKKHMKKHISRYKEKSHIKKFDRFRFELYMRAIWESEDLIRYFFWNTTPYYSNPFNLHCMSVDEGKKDILFFRDFLYAIDPKTCNVSVSSNFSAPISLKNMRKLKMMRYDSKLTKYPRLRKAHLFALGTKRNLFHGQNTKQKSQSKVIEEFRKLLLDVIRKSDLIRQNFSIKETEEYIKNEENIAGFYRMVPLFLYMEYLEKTQN